MMPLQNAWLRRPRRRSHRHSIEFAFHPQQRGVVSTLLYRSNYLKHESLDKNHNHPIITTTRVVIMVNHNRCVCGI